MKKLLCAIVVAGALVTGGLASGTAHATLVAQDPQQALIQAFDALPAPLQQQIVVAYNRNPYQVRQTLGYLESLGPDAIDGDFQLLAAVWSQLPSNYQQAFVDGFLDVSPQEDAFAFQVIQNYEIEDLCGTGAGFGITVPGC